NQLQETCVVANAELEDGCERARPAQPVAGAAAARGVRLRRQTDRRARPLARRADRTLRPPTVLMRARKPWVRARRSFDGSYVSFMSVNLWVACEGQTGHDFLASRPIDEKPYIRAR